MLTFEHIQFGKIFLKKQNTILGPQEMDKTANKADNPDIDVTSRLRACAFTISNVAKSLFKSMFNGCN